MKKRLLACFLTAAFTLALLSGCSLDSSSSAPANADHTEENELTKVTLNEVAHSIFYAPMYVAVEEGYFAEEGIDLDLVCGFGDNMLGKDDDVKMVQYSTPELMPRGVLCCRIRRAGTCPGHIRTLRHSHPARRRSHCHTATASNCRSTD